MRHLAYLDAGTGSLFIQAIFGAMLAGAVILRGFIYKGYEKVRTTFSRQVTKDEEA